MDNDDFLELSSESEFSESDDDEEEEELILVVNESFEKKGLLGFIELSVLVSGFVRK